jgi:hypothetical protein
MRFGARLKKRHLFLLNSPILVSGDPNGAVCNAGSRGCPCIISVNGSRAGTATSDASGECAYGLECRNLVCIGVADDGFKDEAMLKAAYNSATALALSWLVIAIASIASMHFK